MIETLLAKISANKTSDRELVRHAFEFAKKAHAGQKRADGQPYIVHPVAAAKMLANWKLDSTAIAACLLHDVLEDTAVTETEMEKEFGKEVTFLVKAVTKLSGLTFQGESDKTKQNLKAHSLRKMFFAMAEDIRVILIKLADRYNNMTTIGEKAPEARQRISLETLEIYAPIAERLGMGQIKGELEDMAFPHAFPQEHAWLTQKVQDKYNDRHRYLQRVQPLILKKLAKSGMAITNAHARAKHYYSLYKKAVKQDFDLSRIYDLVALRLILPDISACYEALGIVHKNYKPVPGLIKDYIALPKLNGYRSIHTTVFCEEGKILEIQLRTPEMHEHAENGIAAHWSYGESGKNKLHTANLQEAAWVAKLKQWMADIGSQDFYQTLKTNFFSNRIFVLTPQGDVKDLPEGSTPLDFAYAVHTAIGHSAKAAKVSGKLVPLSYQLKSGEMVEIIKAKKTQPSYDWLQIVKTNEAKKKIQAFLKEKGPPPVKTGPAATSPALPSQKILTATPQKNSSPKVFVTGQAHVLYTIAHCCSPLPGDEILGHLTKQKGVAVHRSSCPHLPKFNPQKLITVAWPKTIDYLPMRLTLTIKDKIGMLEEIGRIMHLLKINILEVKNIAPVNGIAEIHLTLALKNADHGKKLLQKLEDHKDILSARRLV